MFIEVVVGSYHYMQITVGGVINYKLSQIETTNAYQTLITPHTMGKCADIAHRERSKDDTV